MTVVTTKAHAPKRGQSLVNYRRADALDTACGSCRYFLADYGPGCQLVAGSISADMTCELFEEVGDPREMEFVMYRQDVDVAKVDDERQFVFGWANVAFEKDGTQVEDHHEDLIDVEDLENAAYTFVLEFRETGEMHKGAAKGELIESMVFTPEKLELLGLEKAELPQAAWWVGFYVADKEAFEKVKRGEYKMFSIQGRAIREEVED